MREALLLDDFESGALAVTSGGTGEQRANGLNGLAVTTNHSADIALSQLEFENDGFATGNLGKHHLVGKLDQLTDDKLEKFFHDN